MKTINLILVILVSMFLAGCQIVETAQKVIEVVKDPDVQVGEDGDQASVANITFFSQRNANRNAFGEAVPVTVLVLQMRGEAGLNQADIFEFMDDPAAAVGADYIDSSEHSIPPGEFLSLDTLELSEETAYLGFAALFADPQGATWHLAEAVEAVGKTYVATIEIGAKQLRVAMEDK